jgi:26S proteasome regulatory subunit N9
MDLAWKVLDQLSGVDNAVNAAYYGVAADYYKVSPHQHFLFVCNFGDVDVRRDAFNQAKAEYAPYYRNSLLYLACVDLATDMSIEERLVRAHDLGISAFLGDTIYNFGELVRDPLCGCLCSMLYLSLVFSLCTQYWMHWTKHLMNGSRNCFLPSMKAASASLKL